MTLLGCVAEVNESDVLLHLANGVKAVVNAANVSDVVTRQYQAALGASTGRRRGARADASDDSNDERSHDADDAAANDDDDAAANDSDNDDSDNDDDSDVSVPSCDVNSLVCVLTRLTTGFVTVSLNPFVSSCLAQALPVLNEFVRVGQLLPVVVVARRSRLMFSLLASRVNNALTRDLLVPGVALAGSVLAVEDRGYSVDIGLEGFTAFLPFSAVASSNDVDVVDDNDAQNDDDDDKQAASRTRLRVGEPVLAAVAAVPDARGPVQLTLKSDAALARHTKLAFAAARAGMHVEAKVVAHVANGVVARFGGVLVGTIVADHLDGTEFPEVGVKVSVDDFVLFETAFICMNQFRRSCTREYYSSIQRQRRSR